MCLGAGCNIALYYYGGFCYLLLRRYLDAARAFNTVLNYISRCAGCPDNWHALKRPLRTLFPDRHAGRAAEQVDEEVCCACRYN